MLDIKMHGTGGRRGRDRYRMKYTLLQFINGNMKNIKEIVQGNNYKRWWTFDDSILAQGFIEACRKGHFEVIKYLCNLHKDNPQFKPIDIHFNNEEGFISACRNGYYDIVLYLTRLHKTDTSYKQIDIYASYEAGFNEACANGHLNIVEYLVKLSTSKGYVVFRSIFYSRMYKHINIVKYLTTLYIDNPKYKPVEYIHDTLCCLYYNDNYILYNEVEKYILNLYKTCGLYKLPDEYSYKPPPYFFDNQKIDSIFRTCLRNNRLEKCIYYATLYRKRPLFGPKIDNNILLTKYWRCDEYDIKPRKLSNSKDSSELYHIYYPSYANDTTDLLEYDKIYKTSSFIYLISIGYCDLYESHNMNHSYYPIKHPKICL